MEGQSGKTDPPTMASTAMADGSTAAAPELLLKRLDYNVTKHASKKLLSYISPGPNGGKLQRQLTYAEVGHETSQMAQQLREAGISKGDRCVNQVIDVSWI
jgi:acyl-coenzyme A synthetase/AMP-(fatty) acid ligase